MADPIVRFVAISKTYDGVARVVDHLDRDSERGDDGPHRSDKSAQH